MSKELEDLENYLFNEWKQNHVNFGCDYKLEAELEKQLNNLKSVKQALQRLEQIDNANPSEALNGLEFICKILNEKRIDIKWLFKNEYNTIKATLLKTQEDKKILDILKRIIKVKKSDMYEFVLVVRGTDEEEFDLLKRWLG